MSVGPADRVHFLDEQRRNRRRSLRFGVFAIVAVAVAGIPLCVLIAPLGLGLTLVIAQVVDLFAPLGDAEWAVLHDAIFVAPTVWSKLRGSETAISWRLLGVIYIVPGAVAMLMTWPLVRRLSRRAGVGSILRHLAAREPDTTILAEQQIVNVVLEMGVAAGVAAPAVRVIDSTKVNAVAIGLTVNDATVLVTSGFLEALDRDERQAIVAHLVGSVGNGDLEIAATIFSVFETWALVAILLQLPLSARRRQFARRFARVAYQEVRGRASPDDVREIVDGLLIGSAADVEDAVSAVEGLRPTSPLHGCFLILVQMPLSIVIALSTVSAREGTNLVTLLVLGPWLSAMWRARRRLADATAVQLTRNPSALASAVKTLGASDVVVTGGWPVNFLFPVWVGVTTDQPVGQLADASSNVGGMRLETEPRLEQLAALGAHLEGGVRRTSWFRSLVPSWRDLGLFAMWAVVAVTLMALVMAATLVSASLVLMALWWLGAKFKWGLGRGAAVALPRP
jgi:Zn-dependent protease with chaperone function